MNKSIVDQSFIPASYDSWQSLIEQGDGYLTPAQRQAFEKAITMVIERLQTTLGKPVTPAERAEQFDFQHYIAGMEERFLADASELDELQQDAALTAARVIEQIAQLIHEEK